MNNRRLEEVAKVVIPIHVPLMSPDKLADLWTPQENDLAGDARPSQIEVMKTRIVNQSQTGLLPSFHIGKRLAINLVQLAIDDSLAVPGRTLQLEFIPPVLTLPMDTFAERAGFSVGVVEGWVKRGYIPSVKKGAYRMISLVHLIQLCLNRSPAQWSALVDRTQPTQSAKRSSVLEAV